MQDSGISRFHVEMETRIGILELLNTDHILLTFRGIPNGV